MTNDQIRRLASDIIADANSKTAALDTWGDGILNLQKNGELQRQLGRIDTAKALLELVSLNERLGVAA